MNNISAPVLTIRHLDLPANVCTFVLMGLRWERTHSDLYFGFAGASQVAQVAHVFGTDGTDHGWMVLLSPDQEFFDRYRTSDEAIAAAEAALSFTGSSDFSGVGVS